MASALEAKTRSGEAATRYFSAAETGMRTRRTVKTMAGSDVRWRVAPDGHGTVRQARANAAGGGCQPSRSVRRATMPRVEPWTMMVKSTTA